MTKTFLQNAENRSAFLTAHIPDGNGDKKGERTDTSPMQMARHIEIERIKPDPNQPRKNFIQDTLESLAESIREVGEIIDPLTVEYDGDGDFFRIISGERRYRAAKIVGMRKLPCLVKEYNDRTRLLVQFIANVQREDMSPLEESAGIKALMEKFGYSQVKTAKVLNKSESYISQIVGLQRLTNPARQILQTSEVSKEIQIRASKEKEPDQQYRILKQAAEEGKTVRQARAQDKKHEPPFQQNAAPPGGGENLSIEAQFRQWSWKPEDGRFVVTIRFARGQNESQKIEMVRSALEATCNEIKTVSLPRGPSQS